MLTLTNFKCFKPVNVSNGNYLSKVSLYSNKYHKENSNFNISSCHSQNTRKACTPNHFVLFLFTLYRFKIKSSKEKRQQNTVSFGSFVPSRREKNRGLVKVKNPKHASQKTDGIWSVINHQRKSPSLHLHPSLPPSSSNNVVIHEMIRIIWTRTKLWGGRG